LMLTVRLLCNSLVTSKDKLMILAVRLRWESRLHL
jgi:hypothetical protein